MTEIARTYGEALYELARDEQLDDRLLGELQTADRLLRENPEYLRLLALPSISKRERCALLDESFGGRAHPYLVSFMKLLVERGAIRQLAGCEEAYRRRYNDDHGILEVTAVAAAPLTGDAEARLRAKLEQKTGKTVRLVVRVDQSVLGGVRLEYGGRRFDGTVRGRLDELQARLDRIVL